METVVRRVELLVEAIGRPQEICLDGYGPRNHERSKMKQEGSRELKAVSRIVLNAIILFCKTSQRRYKCKGMSEDL